MLRRGSRYFLSEYSVVLFVCGTKFSTFVEKINEMGSKEKLIERFLAQPKDFTYDEVVRLFGIFGYSESHKGSTSGSRVEFISQNGQDSYFMHKPHPSNIIKGYVMKQLLVYVRDNNLIEKYKQNKL